LDEAVESLAFAIIEVLIGSGIFLSFILKYIRGSVKKARIRTLLVALPALRRRAERSLATSSLAT
jgi:hypothetical protein